MTLNKLICRVTSKPEEGNLCVAEGGSFSIPFDIKRVYYIYGAKENIVRGHHAHKKLEQILICAYGAIEITLDYGNGKQESIVLRNPSDGLYVGPSVWRTMKWLESDSVLLVLASGHYDESDYIRDYDEFISWLKDKKEG